MPVAGVAPGGEPPEGGDAALPLCVNPTGRRGAPDGLAPRVCPLCVLLAAAVMLALAVFAVTLGDARPERLQARAQGLAAQRLQAAGFPWARLDIEGRVGRLAGEAPDADAQQAAWGVLPGLLDDLVGWTGMVQQLENAATVSPCGERLRQALALPAVRFGAGSHHLDPFAEPLIAELAATAERCPDWTFVIEASLDGSAFESGVRRLGQRRAQAVAAALMLLGVPVDRIESRAAARSDPDRRVAVLIEHEPAR